MKQFRFQTHLMPEKNGQTAHQQKKSVTKVTVEAVGSVDSVLINIVKIPITRSRSSGGGGGGGAVQPPPPPPH